MKIMEPCDSIISEVPILTVPLLIIWLALASVKIGISDIPYNADHLWWKTFAIFVVSLSTAKVFQ